MLEFLPAVLLFGTPLPAADTLAIRDVSVLPMTGGEILPHRTVVIAGARILVVGPASAARIPSRATVIDGRGKFLIPGLADMHVHLSGTEELGSYLGYGVLTVRDLNGSPETLGWRHAVETVRNHYRAEAAR